MACWYTLASGLSKGMFLLLGNLGVVAGIAGLLWLLSIYLRDVSIVDVYWGMIFCDPW